MTDDVSLPLNPAVRSMIEQFYNWEPRGRGWICWDEPVQLEPPFQPFFWQPPGLSLADDGRRHTLVSGLIDTVAKFFRRTGAFHQVPEIEEVDPPAWEDPVDWCELQLSVPPNVAVQREMAEALLIGCSTCRFPVGFEWMGLSSAMTMQIVCADVDVEHVRSQITGFFPEILVKEERGFLRRQWSRLDGAETVVADFGLSRECMLPLAIPRTFAVDPLIGITSALSNLDEGEFSLVQVLFEPVRHAWAESLLRAVTFLDGSEFFDSPHSFEKSAIEKTSKPLYAVVIRCATRSDDSDRAIELARRLAGAFKVSADPAGNELLPLANDDYDDDEHAADILFRRSRRSGMILNVSELATLAHMPTPAVRSPLLKRGPERTKPAPAIVTQGTLCLGENDHAGNPRRVFLSPDQRTKHIHIVGASGTGKSTFLLNLILQDIERGEGIAVLDPHGDLVDAILERVPERRISDVVLLDPGDEAFPVGFNILAAHSEAEKTMLASDLVAVFRRLSTSWGDQMNAVLANGVLAILEHEKGGTLADLRRLLVEKPFRESFLKDVQDEQVVYYWKKEFPLLTGRPQGPVLTRLDAFLRPKTIRYMMCQQSNKLDFGHIMDRGKIFLARLSHGAIGEENAHLLGAFLVSKFHQVAMGRQHAKQADRRDFWLYVDEFQHFATPSMAAALAGVRKYRLGLVLAHQDLYQLESKAPEVATSVLSNAYTRVCFRLGDQDARKLETGFAGFEAKDLQNLGIGEAICRVERAEFDFNLRVPPIAPAPIEGANVRERIIARCRESYAVPREVIAQSLRSAAESRDVELDSTVIPAPAKNSAEKPAVAAHVPVAPKSDASTPTIEPMGVPEASRPTPSPVPRESTPGRGGSQHKYLQQLIKQWGDGMGFRSSIERTILEGEGSIDIALEKPGRSIACLVSVTTGEEWELASVRKSLKAGFEPVLVICPDTKHLARLQKAIAAALDDSERAKTHFMLPDAVFAFIQALEVKCMATEKTVRGYRVKTDFKPMDVAEADRRRHAVSDVVARSLSRKRKK